MIQIKSLESHEVDEALTVYEATFGARDHTTKEELITRLEKGTGIFYVAVDIETNQIVGIKFGYTEGTGCIGRGIAVLPTYRRRGIATSLLRHFEAALAASPIITNYAFGSGTDEGVPFHIASGYIPKALLQFNDQELRQQLDLTGFQIAHEGYNETYKIYQIYLELEQPDQNLAYLRQLEEQFPETNVQFMFSKEF
ncbi:GNAT family N-acetyltransferase [Chloroflexi bacterium TSY]|nr:GNAT family N-acetyltransferase [Chloroflexi bacterium TSY]